MHKIGIIGFGRMGKIRAKAIEEVKGGEITAVYDAYPTDFCGYQSKASAEEIINDSTIDVVFICTPNSFNKKFTIQALNAGKHVFCEKPPAFTASEVIEIKEAELKSGKKLMYGFNHRHHGSIKKVKELIDSGDYGQVLWMRGRYGKSVDETYYNDWRSKPELAGGGILLDQGIHMLDLFLHLGGTFDEVHAFVQSLYWNLPGIEDNVFAIMRNSKTGLAASLHSTMTQWRHLFSIEIFLQSGYMVINGLKTSSGTYGDEELTIAKNRSKAPAATWQDEEKFIFHVDTSWADEVGYYFDALNNNTPIETGNTEQALSLMQLIDIIYENERHTKSELYNTLQ